MRLLSVLLFACFLLGQPAHAAETDPVGEFLETSTDPLFISLGSFCGPAKAIMAADLRKAAFPFDWMLSVDGEQLIKMFDEDFAHFTDPKHLQPFNKGILTNTRYHIEYSHEGNWTSKNFVQNLGPFQKKYRRRINRLRQVRHYHGKVYFVRAAWSLSTHRNYAFSCPGNLEITEEYANRLYGALTRYFPLVDVYLVVVNTPREGEPPSFKLFGKVLILENQLLDLDVVVQAFDSALAGG